MAFFNYVRFRCLYFIVVILLVIPLMVSLRNLHNSNDPIKMHRKNNPKGRSLLLHSSESDSVDSKQVIPGEELIPLTQDVYVAGFKDFNRTICPNLGAGRDLLILITSAPPNNVSRAVIRKTWGSYAKSQNISIAFILGATSNKTDINLLEKEQRIFGDLILAKSLDTYNNLTLKTLSVLEFTRNFCPKVGFVLKTDDDVFINVFKLNEFISSRDPSQKAIYGRLAKNWKPLRNKTSKYYISYAEFSGETFPDFTTGPAYIFSANVADELYKAALKTKFFKLEDVFMTGIVAERLNIQRNHVVNIANRVVTYAVCNVKRLISIHPVKNATKQEKLWNMALDRNLTYCRYNN